MRSFLSFSHVPGVRSSENLAKVILDVLLQYWLMQAIMEPYFRAMTTALKAYLDDNPARYNLRPQSFDLAESQYHLPCLGRVIRLAVKVLLPTLKIRQHIITTDAHWKDGKDGVHFIFFRVISMFYRVSILDYRLKITFI